MISEQARDFARDPASSSIVEPPAGVTGPLARRAPRARRLERVLVADDEHFVAADLTFALARAGFTPVGPVHDGPAAVELARRTLPDMALLDIRMPGMDGLETARELTESLDIACVIVSAYSEDRYVRTAGEVGALGFLVKPVQGEQLRACLELAWDRFCRLVADRLETRSLRQRLDDRRIIEQAKWALVSTRGLTEPQAQQVLQSRARQSRRPVAWLAAQVLRGEGLD